MLGYLYAETDIDEAVKHYNQAIMLTRSEAEKQTLRKEIKRLMPLTTPLEI
jgi:RNA polymerase sigma-70 factor (ECF subfamily)